MAKVQEQKGKIISNPPTMKSETTSERLREDNSNQALRKSGQTLGYMSPQKKKK